jgi:hypothetical protein
VKPIGQLVDPGCGRVIDYRLLVHVEAVEALAGLGEKRFAEAGKGLVEFAFLDTVPRVGDHRGDERSRIRGPR